MNWIGDLSFRQMGIIGLAMGRCTCGICLRGGPMENKIGLRFLPFWLGMISLTLSLVYLLARSHSFFGFRVGKHLDLLGASSTGALWLTTTNLAVLNNVSKCQSSLLT